MFQTFSSTYLGNVCCLHCAHDSKGPIILFNQESLLKVQDILKLRKIEGLKYGTFDIPTTVETKNGYHMDCYRKFTALSKSQRNKLEKLKQKPVDTSSNNKTLSGIQENNKIYGNSQNTSSSMTKRSDITSPKPSKTGIFPNACLFCNQQRKRVSGEEQKLVNVETKNFENSIRKYVEWKNDVLLSARLSGVDFAAKEIKYHAICRLQYQTEAEGMHNQALRAAGMVSVSDEGTSVWHQNRQAHKKAFEALCSYLQEVVIENKEVLLLTEVNNYYQHLLHEFQGNDIEVTSSAQKLEEKIKKHYEEKISIVNGKKKRGNIIFGCSLSLEEAVQKLNVKGDDVKAKVRDIALLLREEINKAERCALPNDMKLDDILKGEVEVPDLVITFFQNLIGGPDTRRWKSTSKNIRIKSLSEDAVFATTAGLKKPQKHLMLGIALKSLTGSRKVIEIVNRLGHCASYHTIQEIETETTFESAKQNLVTPNGMKLNPHCGTGVAWDNFDRFVDTVSGKETLHDTVGIAYQTITEEEPIEQEATDDEHPSAEETSFIREIIEVQGSLSKRKRRRAYHSSSADILPYRKKPKLRTSDFLSNNNPKRLKYESSSASKRNWKIDILWMLNYVANSNSLTPLWPGWNSRLITPKQYTQKVWYLPQINQSPTNHSVVAETMRRSQKIAQEANKNSIAVTYDLAIAKIAMQIQKEESPLYDNIFVALGSFHVEMAYFKALGKIISESGGPYLLQECDLSTKSFLSGLSYNKCKRFHEILSVAFEVMHFKAFIDIQDDQDEILETISSEITHKNDINETFSREINEIFERYDKFTQDTENGLHGKTAKFWIQYLYQIHLYHNFTRSVRSGDLDLYLSCLPEITNLFFALNHMNYARWLVRYYDSLIKLPETHPEVNADFKKGWFGIKRTGKPFSSTPIDLTLEQTINADASSQRFGITSMTNSISARQRWAESHFFRTNIISSLLDMLDLKKKEDVSQYLRHGVMVKDNAILHKVLNLLSELMNPFKQNDKERLYNIATGKAASSDTEEFLLSVNKRGETARMTFISECIERPERFEERITKQKIQTFETDLGKKKVQKSNGKVVAACFVRDLFGSLLCLSLEEKIDMSEVLSFPLTTFPLSLCHSDGSMLSSPKSNLTKYLETFSVTGSPKIVHETIIDAMFFLRLHVNLPHTFESLARYILARIVSCEGDTIHFVCDKWIQPSIKDCEREDRGSLNGIYSIKGPAQTRPSDWNNALKNRSFKESLIGFLVEAWKDNSCATILKHKTIYANFNDHCFKYQAENGVTIATYEESFYSMHEEADNRMFFHLNHAQPGNTVVIRTDDTDSLVIALGNKHLFSELQIWLEVGVQGKNNLRFIDVKTIHSELGETLCKSLPAYHALTGCDYTASFFKKGKVRPLKLLQKYPDIQMALAELSSVENINENIFSTIESYVCKIYGSKTIDKVNDLRTHIFTKKYNKIKPEDRLDAVKKFDSSLMPPCKDVLLLKLKRVNLITRRWASAVRAHPPNDRPEDFGWTLSNDGQYIIKWFEGPAAPRVLDVTISEDTEPTTEDFTEGTFSYRFCFSLINRAYFVTVQCKFSQIKNAIFLLFF